MPISVFYPHPAYATAPERAVDEFRQMVRALHEAGIEVILDVVFNHTAEGNHNGPTISFRGLDNSTYYLLESDRSRYANYSGTGNTLNANNPIVRRMILDSLRYWVHEMHVDGFRFDLASILSRDSTGQPLMEPPVLWDIESDPTLAGTKMIAEAWDAAGLYQVGSFAGDSWREWNGQFRDDVRGFFRCDEGSVSRIADRFLGSPQIYGHKEREAEVSVNFVTCHDGFTANDLVSYDAKHNEANEEDNRDGTNDNRSWNCGVEGDTCDARVDALRNRQVKNLLSCTLLSLGMPMIGMGDEVRRTQRGNNNAYCQDNETSWFDWSLIPEHADVHRFVKLVVERRLARHLGDGYEGETLNQWLRQSNRAWHGVRLNQPDWSDGSHSLALSAENRQEKYLIHYILNAYWEPLDFELPRGGNASWRRWIDTSLESPEDIVGWQEARPCVGPMYRVGPQSVAVLYTPVG
jgi:isoamylase